MAPGGPHHRREPAVGADPRVRPFWGITDCHIGGICLRDYAPFLFACAKRSGKRKTHKATQHRDLFAPKGMFFSYTAPSKHGRRQPCRASLSCLSEKHLPWECIAVLNKIFFLSAMPTDAEILCVLQIRWRKLWGKIFIQNRLNPYAVSPRGTRQCVPLWNPPAWS